MSGQDILIEQLRAEVERLTKLHGRELLERMEAERERDEWKARHDTLADVSRACIATAERERDEARAERDARPDISAEDAAGWVAANGAFYEPTLDEKAAWNRADDALRAHAAKVKP